MLNLLKAFSLCDNERNESGKWQQLCSSHVLIPLRWDEIHKGNKPNEFSFVCKRGKQSKYYDGSFLNHINHTIYSFLNPESYLLVLFYHSSLYASFFIATTYNVLFCVYEAYERVCALLILTMQQNRLLIVSVIRYIHTWVCTRAREPRRE